MTRFVWRKDRDLQIWYRQRHFVIVVVFVTRTRVIVPSPTGFGRVKVVSTLGGLAEIRGLTPRRINVYDYERDISGY